MRVVREDELYHFGIKGMRKGQRRWTNPDGTLNEAGKRRYGIGDGQQSGQTLFVSGSSKTQDKASGYYRKKLPKQVRSELDSSMKNRDKIIVGDAPGVDRQVQKYLKKKHYKDVEVYGPGKEVRYSANKKWKTNAIDDPDHEPMSKEWLAKKDKAMTDASTKGLAVILDEGAQATRNNVRRLVEQNKNVKVFELTSNKKWDHYISGKGLVDQMIHDEVRKTDYSGNITKEQGEVIDKAIAASKKNQPANAAYDAVEFQDDKYGHVTIMAMGDNNSRMESGEMSKLIKNELGMISGKPDLNEVANEVLNNRDIKNWFNDGTSEADIRKMIMKSQPQLFFYLDPTGGSVYKHYWLKNSGVQDQTGGHDLAVDVDFNPKSKRYEPNHKSVHIF